MLPLSAVGRAQSMLPTQISSFSPVATVGGSSEARLCAALLNATTSMLVEVARNLGPYSVGKDMESMLEFCIEADMSLATAGNFVRVLSSRHERLGMAFAAFFNLLSVPPPFKPA